MKRAQTHDWRKITYELVQMRGQEQAAADVGCTVMAVRYWIAGKTTPLRVFRERLLSAHAEAKAAPIVKQAVNAS